MPVLGHVPSPESAVALIRRYFLNRTDRLCARRPNDKPCPIEGGEDLDAKLTAHVLGDAAPKVTIRCVPKDKDSWKIVGRFRLGSYSPDLENRSIYGTIDADGDSHPTALADPLGVALAIQDHLEQLSVTPYLEASGSATGWHTWVFFSDPVPACKIRKLLFAVLPADAKLKDGTHADARANKGLEVFPKQDRHADKDGIGNQVWLPWWFGAKPGGNQFYQVQCDGELTPYIPQNFATHTEADLDAALKQLADKTASSTFVLTVGQGQPDERELALSALAGLSARRVADYDSWLKVGMALHSVDSSGSMWAEWDSWSRQAPDKYEEGACPRKWASFGKTGVTLGSLIHWAREDGWSMPGPRRAAGKSQGEAEPVKVKLPTPEEITLAVLDTLLHEPRYALTLAQILRDAENGGPHVLAD